MQNVIPDERYSVADEAILGAFFKLLKEKKPDRITVSDITKTAGIARSTFYNHYQDIPSLISAVEDKTIHDVFSMMENFQPKNDRDICSSYFLTLCRYTMENPFLSGLLSTPHGNDLFEKMLTMLHHYVTETTSNSRPDRHTKEEVSYVITCAIGSTIGVLHKWSRDNFNLAPEVIAEKRHIYKGVSANVDFYSGFVYSMLDIPLELYTPIFAIARIVGWSAHRMEELVNMDKIIRPAYRSIMPEKVYVPLEEREQ